jgi:hypothetical protein
MQLLGREAKEVANTVRSCSLFVGLFIHVLVCLFQAEFINAEKASRKERREYRDANERLQALFSQFEDGQRTWRSLLEAAAHLVTVNADADREDSEDCSL